MNLEGVAKGSFALGADGFAARLNSLGAGGGGAFDPSTTFEKKKNH